MRDERPDEQSGQGTIEAEQLVSGEAAASVADWCVSSVCRIYIPVGCRISTHACLNS